MIPVTGDEVPFAAADAETKRDFMTRASYNTSLLFFGLGMVFHGAVLWHKRKADQI